MARANKQVKNKPRNSYNEEYVAEALKLADSIGVSTAAQQLGIHTSQIYSWRSKQRKSETQSDAEKRLLAETAKLKR